MAFDNIRTYHLMKNLIALYDIGRPIHTNYVSITRYSGGIELTIPSPTGYTAVMTNSTVLHSGKWQDTIESYLESLLAFVRKKNNDGGGNLPLSGELDVEIPTTFDVPFSPVTEEDILELSMVIPPDHLEFLTDNFSLIKTKNLNRALAQFKRDPFYRRRGRVTPFTLNNEEVFIVKNYENLCGLYHATDGILMATIEVSSEQVTKILERDPNE